MDKIEVINNLDKDYIEEIEILKKITSMVLNKHIPEEEIDYIKIKLMNEDFFKLYPNKLAFYITGTFIFSFIIERLNRLEIEGLNKEQILVLAAAHEAFHKVQEYKGEYLEDNFYDEREINAWEEAVQVFKYIYPNHKNTYFQPSPTSEYSVIIPKTSKYLR